MNTFRKLVAGAAIASVVAILPIGGLGAKTSPADPATGGVVIKPLGGGQGGWPLKV